MENRKCIAVLTEKPSLDYQSGILKGIYRSAFSHDTNVAVFCVTSTRSDEAYQIGEMVIFSLLGDYSRFSGVIYLPDTIDYSMRDTLITEKLIAASRKIKIPVVTIDGNYDEFPCFLSDDSEPIQFLVDHLSAGHGCKDIAFVTGRKNHPHAEHRLEAFSRAMSKNNLEIRENRIFYGDFWRTCGEDIVSSLLAGESGLPEAIICANSYMADGIYEALYKRGFRAPRDIKLACYGEKTETSEYISATIRATDSLGFSACEGLFSMINGGSIPSVNRIPTEFQKRPAMTCGCMQPDEYNLLDFRMKDPNEVSDFFTEYNTMSESLIRRPNIRETLWTANWYTHLFGDFTRFSVCMCDDVVKPELSLDENDVCVSYTDEMLMVLDHKRLPDGTSDAFVGTDRRFPVSEVYHPLFSADGDPAAYVFRQLHFIERCYGYAVLSYGSKIISPQASFDFWVNVLANAVESQRRLTIMRYLYKKVNQDAVTDSMTGLFNRNGFNSMLPQMITEAREEGKNFLLIMSDLNGLKYVNDSFGHSEGDNLINTAAGLLSCTRISGASCEKNFRIGGDEFVKAAYGDILRPMDGFRSYEPAQLTRCIDHEALMVLMFTSGTTGRSKGVMLSEKNFFSVMRAHTQIGEHMMEYKHDPDLVMSQYTVLPMFHLGAFICLFSWAHAGWALNVSSDIRNFYKEVKRMPSQAMAVVPVIVNSLHHDVMRGRKDRLGELWVPICSSAMFDPQVMLDMAEHGMFVVQTYGSTETCGDGIINYAQDAKHIGAVGQGNDYLDYKIAEDGELCMRGDSIMLGYYKDPEATAEVIDADGWFHTGDLARKDEDGYYFLVGRKKNLIILDSGENISPEELEGIVGKCEAVKECVVKEMGKKIGVVVYCDEDKQQQVRDFITEANRTLPLYKRMSAVEFSTEPLPRNGAGKLLRQ